ncbi:methyltransferase [Actinoalloteichus caeruleus]|uniref:methyltransferase n=1 Tax=Actinoalloteichus cyanogriseus TaxID=2893586 RepID=UPI0012DD64BC|nr:methyltransferase [Actinoalloteichus caeruleus]
MTASPRPCPAQVPDSSGALRLARFFAAGCLGQALAALVRAGVVREMARDRPSVDELAHRTGTDPATLSRFLRAGEAAGVFVEDPPHHFALSDTGELLAEGPGSLGGLLELANTAPVLAAWSAAEHTLRTGESAFAAVHGSSVFDHLAQAPALAGAVGRAMGASVAAELVPASVDLPSARHVVDVGAGGARLLTALLAAQPHLVGTLVGVPTAAREQVAEELRRSGVRSRCRLPDGEVLPQDGDVYLLCHVLPCLDDEDAVSLLRSLVPVLREGARLLVIGFVPSARDRTPVIPALDVWMAAMCGGRQRTEHEYSALLDRAGLLLRARHGVRPDTECVLEVVRR